MKVSLSFARETAEVQLIRDFCKWQGFTVVEKKGPLLVEFPVTPGLGISIERTSGLINFIDMLKHYGLLRC